MVRASVWASVVVCFVGRGVCVDRGVCAVVRVGRGVYVGRGVRVLCFSVTTFKTDTRNPLVSSTSFKQFRQLQGAGGNGGRHYRGR